jgi:hypothetical protein
MRKQNLQARIDRLMALPKNRKIPWGKIYNALAEMDWRTTGAADQGITFDDFLVEYEKTEGTKEQFIIDQSAQWAQQHGNRRPDRPGRK